MNLGVIQQNPSTARRTLEILKILQQYVPLGHDGHPYPIVCHGDQLSVERMVEAKLSMWGPRWPAHWTHPSSPGFPQEVYNTPRLYEFAVWWEKCGRQRVTLSRQEQVWVSHCEKKISDCVNSVVDFFDFVTEASVCMIVCRILNINNIDDISDALPDDNIDRLTVFHELVKRW